MPLRARLHRRLQRLSHGATEGDAGRQLLRHTLGDELRVDLRVVDLADVDPHLLAGDLPKLVGDDGRFLAPRRPMTMPGRAVWTYTATRSRVRSISMLDTPARSMPAASEYGGSTTSSLT